jgi:hypothetical protein
VSLRFVSSRAFSAHTARSTLSLPLPTPVHAERLQRILAVDLPQRSRDVHLTYTVPSAPVTGAPAAPAAPAELLVHLRTRSLRHLRLAAGTLCEDARLIIDTMASCEPEVQGTQGDAGAANGGQGAAADKDGEVELGSIGRAG